jgi:hypothetical protein
MGEVMTTCPVTGQPIATGIDTDEASFARVPAFTAKVFCPHCQSEHDWSKDKAWVAEDGKPKS